MQLLKKYKQVLRVSITALLANKGRSFLTMLGIIIGVCSVIVIISVGAGAQSLILSQIKTMGTNLIGVLPGNADEKGMPASAMGVVITTLTYDDAMALKNKNNVPNITDVVAYVKSYDSVSWNGNSYETNISGCTTDYFDVEGGEIEQGRFFTLDEEKNLSRVIILGSTVKEELFGMSDPIGQRVKIKKQTFEVIGVMKKRGTVAFQNYDDQVILPIITMQKLVTGTNYLGFLRAKVDAADNIQKAIDDVKYTLRKRHDISDKTGTNDDFNVRNAAQALEIITTVTNALSFFLAAMAALSLIVGGIGIMNIMLVSVSERTREIGLRKAVGATHGNILRQFLMESVTITMIGGILGIIAGIIISLLIAVGANFLGYDWAFVISPVSVLLSVGVSVIIGLTFGLYPARRASRLEPVEALRYE